jgi:hypothetical protein
VLVKPPGAKFAKVFWLLFFKKVTACFRDFGSAVIQRRIDLMAAAGDANKIIQT